MDPTPLLPNAGTNHKLFYIVPLSFLYLYSLLGDSVYLVLTMIALMGAICRHTTGESIYGPRGEEKRELDSEDEIRRTGTFLFRDKAPHQYVATTYKELVQEGEFRSRNWFVVLIIIALFQIAFFVLYPFAIVELYFNREELNFIGLVLLFSMISLPIYGFLKFLLPDASDAHLDMPNMDPRFEEVFEGLTFSLLGDDIHLKEGFYEPAEGGLITITCEVEYEKGEEQEEILDDIHRIAIDFCSLVSRSTYPIDNAKITLLTADEVETKFEIEPEWCRKLSSGGISSDEFFDQVEHTIDAQETPN